MIPYKARLDNIKDGMKSISEGWYDKRKDKEQFINCLRNEGKVIDLIDCIEHLLEIYEYEKRYVDECKIELERALEILEEINSMFTVSESFKERLANNLKLMWRSIYFFVGKDDDVSFLLKLMHGRLKIKILGSLLILTT